MINNYLEILEESLQKKSAVLDEVIEYNRNQEKLLKSEKISMEDLDANMEQKDRLIQKLTELDEGFEALYGRVKEQLSDNKVAYKVQIKRMQELISQITEKSVSVQAQEARNKKLIEDYFLKERNQLRQGKQASKAAYGYYKNMSNTGAMLSQFMDQKK